jgi:DNA polymerase-4
MPTSTARRLCPHAIFLPVRMEHYARIGQQIREILLTFTPLVEPLSLDEAFLDVSGCERLFGPAAEIGRRIKLRIKEETDLTASVGIAPNKFLAKLASDHGKPDGYVAVPHDGVTEFLHPLPIGRIWGVGAKGEKRLHALGIHTIGQLAALPEQVLVDQFGESGRHMWQLAHGLDGRTVIPDRDAKSVSTETTFAHDIGDRHVLRTLLLDLVDHLAGRLRREELLARTIDVKIRSSEFRTWVRSQALPEATHATEVLWRTAAALFERSLTREMLPVRLLGVGVSRLTRDAATQRSLFEAGQRERHAGLDRAVDAIREKLGSDAIQRGSLLKRERAGETE